MAKWSSNSNQCVVFMRFIEANYNSVLVSETISTLRHSQELENWEVEVTQKVVTMSLVKTSMPLLSPSHDREWPVKGKYFYNNNNNKTTHQTLKLHLLRWFVKACW